MSKTDELLRIIGIGAIGVMGMGFVLCMLFAMFILVAIIAYQAYPPVPAVTIGPLEAPAALPTMHPAGVVMFDEVRNIPDGRYQYYSVAMAPGMTVNVSITTDGIPVDVMVMDSANYSRYTAAIDSNGDDNWNSPAYEMYAVQKSFAFTAPHSDRYYIVIDNRVRPGDEAETGNDVDVHTVVTYG